MAELRGLTDEEVKQVCHEPPPETQGTNLNHIMYRIKDPKASLDFYTRILGMRLLRRGDMPGMKFTVYFLGFENAADIPKDDAERRKWVLTRRSVLELTHNYGTESDPDFKGYCNGNTDPGRGYGHIALVVPDLEKACERYEQLGVKFIKRPQDGSMRGLAFIEDPDGYRVEILSSAIREA